MTPALFLVVAWIVVIPVVVVAVLGVATRKRDR